MTRLDAVIDRALMRVAPILLAALALALAADIGWCIGTGAL